MRSIFLQYFKYANVFIYLLEDGSIITLPVHLIRVANVMIGGEPVLEFNCKSVRDDMRQQGTKAQKNFLEDEDLKVRLEGFPSEVADALNKGADWVQLNPENTFVLQDVKEDWMRYAVPMVATCLNAFKRKALIAQYESALLNLGAHSFVHVTYGDSKSDIMPDITALNAVNALFRRAMTGSALATTNQLCKATVIQPDTKEMFDDDKYRDVNAEILSAGGISGIIVSGRAEDGSNFASAQVSMQTAAIRIKQARDNFCELMNKINLRVNGDHLPYSKVNRLPKFEMIPIDLSGTSKFQKTCMELWGLGCLSTETMLDYHGFDWEQEVKRKKEEVEEGTYTLMNRSTLDATVIQPNPAQPETTETPNPVENPVTNPNTHTGRPELDSDERTSDVNKSMTGKQPKPSNPEGSMEE